MARFPNKIGFYRDGIYRKRVKVVSTGSTATYNLASKDSGTVFRFGCVSTVAVGLPKISSKNLGVNYEIYFSTADAEGDYTVGCADTSAGIYLALSSAGSGTPSTITPTTTDHAHGIRVTAVSSIVWMGEPLMISGTTSKTFGSWTTA